MSETTLRELTPGEDNKAVVRRFVDEAQSRGNLAVIDTMMSVGFVDHSPLPGLSPDRDGVRALFGALRTAFPDLQATIHDQLADGDRVVTRKTLAGTHRGPFLGLPPTGNHVAFDVIDILRVVDGKIHEHWCVVDRLALLAGVGAVPAPTR